MNQVQEQKMLDNMGLVHKIVGKYNTHDNINFDYDDQVQEGTIGLMKAIENFDESKNNKFSTYAHHYINGYILRYINQTNSIHVPVHTFSNSKKVEKLLQNNLSIDEICEKLNMDNDKINELINIQNQSIVSLHTKMSNNTETSSYYIDTIPSKNVRDDDLTMDVKNAINKLCQAQKEIIMQIIYKNKKGTDIAKKMNYTKQNVDRIYRGALKKLKEELKEGYCLN